MIKLNRFNLMIAGTVTLLAIGAGLLLAKDEPAKKSDKAYVGVYPMDLDKDKKEALEFKGDGVLIEDVVADGPAQKAGLKAGDIVT